MAATLDNRSGKAHDPAVAATDDQGSRAYDHLGRAVAVHAGLAGLSHPPSLSPAPAQDAATLTAPGPSPSPKAATKRKGAKR